MHELSMANSMVEAILDTAKKNDVYLNEFVIEHTSANAAALNADNEIFFRIAAQMRHIDALNHAACGHVILDRLPFAVLLVKQADAQTVFLREIQTAITLVKHNRFICAVAV